jgi:hypothetical protein
MNITFSYEAIFLHLNGGGTDVLLIADFIYRLHQPV